MTKEAVPEILAVASADGWDGDIPTGWNLVPFARVCAIHKQSFDPTSEDAAPYVGLEHILPGSPRLLGWGRSTDVRSSKTYFYPGQVLYGKLRPYLDKAALAHIEGVCSTDIIVFDSTEESIPEFLVHLLHTGRFLAHATATMTGVNHPRTNWSSLKDYQVPLPPLAEQRRIAAVLNAIQDAIAAQDDVIAAAKAFKRSLMQRLFTYGPGAEPAETKETEIGEMPVHWHLIELGRRYRVFSGYAFRSSDYQSEGIPLIKIGNIQNGMVEILEKNDCVPNAWLGDPKLSRYVLHPGDVLIALTGATTGKIGRVPANLGICFLNQRVGRVHSVTTDTDIDFLAYYMETATFQESIQAGILQSAQGNISPGKLGKISVPHPQYIEQKQIAKMLDAANAKVAAEEDRKTALEALFKSMLHHLMTGQVRLLSDEGLPLSAHDGLN